MPTPVYERIKGHIRTQILEGTLSPGSPVPSENELASKYLVSRGQTRQALRDLEMEGYLIRQRGRGSFVAPAEKWQKHLDVDAIQTLTVAMPQVFDLYNNNVASGFVEAAREKGYHTTFYYLNRQADHELKFLQGIPKRGIHGFALYPTVQSEEEAQMIGELKRKGCPCVMFDRHLTDCYTDFVGTDNRNAYRKLTRILLDRGHENIVFLSRDFLDTVMKDRFTGYYEVMESASFEILAFSADLDPVLRLDYSIMSEERPHAVEFIERCLSLTPAPTAFCCSDNWTAGFLQYQLRRHGLRVPEDIEIATMYDEDVRQEISHSYHIAIQNGFKIGRQAAQMLINRLASPDKEIEWHLYDVDIRLATTLPLRVQVNKKENRTMYSAS